MQEDIFESELSTLANTLSMQMKNNIFDKFIHYAVFPNFKNLEPKSRIDFEYPITVIVGANGTGKSTILHALYGMPEGFSTERFWFSTKLDAIDEGGPSGQHRYFYGHKLNAQIVETRKSRVTNTNRGADYWEPTKPSIQDGMQKVPREAGKVEGRSKDRWNPVKREVLFLNFKSELSAYDKYMYFGKEPKLEVIKTKQDLIRRDSKILKRIIDSEAQSFNFFGSNVIDVNRLLSPNELKAIAEILGREYSEARILRHRLFGGLKPHALRQSASVELFKFFVVG